MMTLDQSIFLLISIGGGFFTGFLSVKTNYILVIITGKILTSGNAERRYVLIGILATILFFVLYLYFYRIEAWFFGILLSSFFVVFFSIGVIIAKHKFSQRKKILGQVIKAMFTNCENTNEIIDETIDISSKTLDSLPASNKEIFLFLLMIFDSRIVVFFTTIFVGHYFSSKRFINMKSKEQDRYMETWASHKTLSLAIQSLKSITNLAHYTNHKVWVQIGYRGGVLKRSYLN